MTWNKPEYTFAFEHELFDLLENGETFKFSSNEWKRIFPLFAGKAHDHCNRILVAIHRATEFGLDFNFLLVYKIEKMLKKVLQQFEVAAPSIW